MICRASDQQAAVAAVMFEKKMSHLELSTSEWSGVEQLKDTLTPFKMAIQALSTNACPTASAVLPLQHVMISQLSRHRMNQPSNKRKVFDFSFLLNIKSKPSSLSLYYNNTYFPR